MLTTEAWNAFLKTLEEPPPHVLFVLATTEPHKVPDTVRSRVQRFDFRRVSAPDLIGHLGRILEAEGTSAEPEALTLIARAGQGSVRDAISMLDQSLAGGARPLTAANVRLALGLADPGTLHGLLEALSGGDGAAALRAVAMAFDAGADPRQLLHEASRLARAAEFTALGHADGAEVTAEETDLVGTLARVAPAGFWLRALALLQATELELRQPVDARLQVEYCVMRLVRETALGSEQLTALEERVSRLEAGSPGSARGPVQAMTPRPRAVGEAGPDAHPTAPPRPAAGPPPADPNRVLPAAVVAPATARPADQHSVPEQALPAPTPTTTDPAGGGGLADPGSWQGQWRALLEAVNRRDRALAGVLRDCRAVAADATTLTIGAPYNFHLEKLRERNRLAILTEAAGEVAGSPRTVDTAYVGEGAAPVRRPGGTGEATQAVLDAFAGSRVTSTRLRDDADPPRGGAA